MLQTRNEIVLKVTSLAALKTSFLGHLRWLERVFKCCKPFETRKDYKEVFLSM